MHGIGWWTLSRILVDMPDYKLEDEKGEGKNIRITAQNAEKMKQKIDKMING